MKNALKMFENLPDDDIRPRQWSDEEIARHKDIVTKYYIDAGKPHKLAPLYRGDTSRDDIVNALKTLIVDAFKEVKKFHMSVSLSGQRIRKESHHRFKKRNRLPFGPERTRAKGRPSHLHHSTTPEDIPDEIPEII